MSTILTNYRLYRKSSLVIFSPNTCVTSFTLEELAFYFSTTNIYLIMSPWRVCPILISKQLVGSLCVA